MKKLNLDFKTIKLNFQEANTMSIFREGFQLEKKSGDYMRLEKGENKIRILSTFIDGWEEWDENRKPVRSRNKPESPREDCKQFVAAIVWNYAQKKVQVLQLTQASVIRKLEALAQDADWGPIFFYDIKITRSGEGKMTKYEVNPSPKKDLAPEIEKAFKEKPCYLEALYTNDDPFGPWPNPTKGVFRKNDFAAADGKINEDQIEKLQELLNDDPDFDDVFRVRLKRAFGSDELADIPASQYDQILAAVLQHFDKRKTA